MSLSSHSGGDSHSTATTDRRAHVRRPIFPRLYVVLDGPASDGILNDVSEGGVALDIVGPQPETEDVVVHFEMSEISQHFEAQGRITWRDEKANRVGVHFVDLLDISRTQLREWLSIKAASAPPIPPPVMLEPQREVASRETWALENAVVSPRGQQQPSQEPKPAQSTRASEYPTSSPAEKPKTAAESAAPTPPIENTPSRSATSTPQPRSRKITSPPAAGSSSDAELDGLLQNLLNSFHKPRQQSALERFKAQLTKTFSKSNIFSAEWEFRRWLIASAAVLVVALLAFAVAAHRSTTSAGGAFSVSKVGRSPSAPNNGSENAQFGGAIPDNTSSTSGNSGGNGPNGSSAAHDANVNPSPMSHLPTAALLSALPKASGRPPCVNLAAPSDTIRIYLWSEKDTPSPIIAAYTKYLRDVSDIRVVDNAPYDLVLYVNGANVNPKSPGAGYIWSSRVFRPWYCGQSLGLLEQTQVSESLHFVPDANLDKRVQSEVAYLILRTFESIRNERTK